MGGLRGRREQWDTGCISHCRGLCVQLRGLGRNAGTLRRVYEVRVPGEVAPRVLEVVGPERGEWDRPSLAK